MKIVLDTSSLIRFFTRDREEKAAKVKVLLETKDISIPDVVFPELEYVLTKSYSYSRTQLTELYQVLISQDTIHVSKEVKQAVTFFSETQLDMADCIIAASSISGKLASFDHDLLRVKTVEPYWK